MSTEEPLPDPRTDVLFSSDVSSDEEEEDICFAVNTSDKCVRSNETQLNGKPLRAKSARKTAQSQRHCTSRIISCTQCQPNRFFKKKKVLDKHMEVIHSLREMPCLWCGKVFLTDKQLRLHQKLYFHDKPIAQN